jgi:hypothetical protein
VAISRNRKRPHFFILFSRSQTGWSQQPKWERCNFGVEAKFGDRISGQKSHAFHLDGHRRKPDHGGLAPAIHGTGQSALLSFILDGKLTKPPDPNVVRKMKTIRVYYNAHCAKCAGFARAAKIFDWLDRVDFSTETPRSEPLRLSKVIVEELSSGRIHKGAEGIELIWRNIPRLHYFGCRSSWRRSAAWLKRRWSGLRGMSMSSGDLGRDPARIKPPQAVAQTKRIR